MKEKRGWIIFIHFPFNNSMSPIGQLKPTKNERTDWRKVLFIIFAVTVVLSVLLAACAPAIDLEGAGGKGKGDDKGKGPKDKPKDKGPEDKSTDEPKDKGPEDKPTDKPKDTPKGGGQPSITICHATGSGANSYMKIRVDDDGVYSGHINHDGDIIPAPAGGCPKGDTPTKTPKVGQKITICHSTGSAENPYEKITVADDGGYNGHIDHEDDIIPAPAGGCPVPTDTPPPSDTPPPTETPPPSDTPPPTGTHPPPEGPLPTETPPPPEITATDAAAAFEGNVAIDEVAAIDEIVDRQLKNSMRSNIVFNRPESMKKGETTVIELYLNPSLSQNALITEIARGGNFVTSAVEPGHLVGLSGEEIAFETVNIEITNRMKATLKSLDPEAFIVQDLHDSPEQAISGVETTVWRWSITAKKEGIKMLVLTLNRLIITSNGSEYWREVDTYKTSIAVEVSPEDKIKSLDWQWIIGILISALSIPVFWGWFESRKKK